MTSNENLKLFLTTGDYSLIGPYVKNKRGWTRLNKLVKLKSIGRNDPCICGSGKKYKQCCMNKRKD